jgi:hypothetical protein
MLAAEDRLCDLFEISIDEVAWRKGHRYLTLVGDHRRRCVVWGREARVRPLPIGCLPSSTPSRLVHLPLPRHNGPEL